MVVEVVLGSGRRMIASLLEVVLQLRAPGGCCEKGKGNREVARRSRTGEARAHAARKRWNLNCATGDSSCHRSSQDTGSIAF